MSWNSFLAPRPAIKRQLSWDPKPGASCREHSGGRLFMLTALSNLVPLPDFIQDCDLSFCKSSSLKSVLSKTNGLSPELPYCQLCDHSDFPSCYWDFSWPFKHSRLQHILKWAWFLDISWVVVIILSTSIFWNFSVGPIWSFSSQAKFFMWSWREQENQKGFYGKRKIKKIKAQFHNHD